MNGINDLFDKLQKKDRIKEWIRVATAEIERFAKTAQSQSRFKDPAKYNREPFRGKFWLNKNYFAQIINLYGISPNPAFIKGVSAPFRKWHNTNPYVYNADDKFFSAKKAQSLTPAIGIKTKESYYRGSETKLFGFFTASMNGKKLIFSRNADGKASVIYADESFADWLYTHFRKDIDDIIYASGVEVLQSVG